MLLSAVTLIFRGGEFSSVSLGVCSGGFDSGFIASQRKGRGDWVA